MIDRDISGKYRSPVAAADRGLDQGILRKDRIPINLDIVSRIQPELRAGEQRIVIPGFFHGPYIDPGPFIAVIRLRLGQDCLLPGILQGHLSCRFRIRLSDGQVIRCFPLDDTVCSKVQLLGDCLPVCFGFQGLQKRIFRIDHRLLILALDILRRIDGICCTGKCGILINKFRRLACLCRGEPFPFLADPDLPFLLLVLHSDVCIPSAHQPDIVGFRAEAVACRCCQFF